MSAQECIGEIGIVRRTRFDDKTQTWYAEAPLDAMCKVVHENERLRREIAQLRTTPATDRTGTMLVSGEPHGGWANVVLVPTCTCQMCEFHRSAETVKPNSDN